MFIFPAIDIQNGECVRLTKGDFATAERVAEDPLQTALAFQEAGAEWIHMVDLDGAKSAQMMNRDIFITVARETELKVEVGGGIRDIKTAEYYLEHGIERVILGSAAVRTPKMIAELVREYGDRIVVGIDAEDGMVKIDGWLNAGKVNFITLAKEMDFIGVKHIIYTDISKDGTLAGPNLFDLKKLRDSVRMNVIASGGIRELNDITELGKLRLYGAICGKSLYRGTLDLKSAIEEGAKYPPMETPDPEEADEAMEAEYLAAAAARARAAAQTRVNGQRDFQSRDNAPRADAMRGKPPRPQQNARPEQNASRQGGGTSRQESGNSRQGSNSPRQEGTGRPQSQQDRTPQNRPAQPRRDGPGNAPRGREGMQAPQGGQAPRSGQNPQSGAGKPQQGKQPGKKPTPLREAAPARDTAIVREPAANKAPAENGQARPNNSAPNSGNRYRPRHRPRGGNGGQGTVPQGNGVPPKGGNIPKDGGN